MLEYRRRIVLFNPGGLYLISSRPFIHAKIDQAEEVLFDVLCLFGLPSHLIHRWTSRDPADGIFTMKKNKELVSKLKPQR